VATADVIVRTGRLNGIGHDGGGMPPCLRRCCLKSR
jgi:hypothetical protein